MLKIETPNNEDKVLLHSCCAPCSSAIIECLLANNIRPTVFYYNRPTQENDPMGEGPVLRALVEMIDAPKYTEISANDQYDKIK